MSDESNLTRSLEDYLETILLLEQKNRVARVKDIADALQVQMPSVTGAVKNLKAKGLVNYQKNSYISLTEKGMKIAQSVLNKHTVLTRFLEKVLLLDSEEADAEACKLEHNISAVTAEKFQRLNEVIDEVLERNIISREDWRKKILE